MCKVEVFSTALGDCFDRVRPGIAWIEQLTDWIMNRQTARQSLASSRNQSLLASQRQLDAVNCTNLLQLAFRQTAAPHACHRTADVWPYRLEATAEATASAASAANEWRASESMVTNTTQRWHPSDSSSGRPSGGISVVVLVWDDHLQLVRGSQVWPPAGRLRRPAIPGKSLD